ncbi:hypothetical protein [Mesorhizobium amorphae]|uniref:hypothetical protein n=1 Tax=Mesorhizobium amorphae TaxID=71433 RepID=UPI001186ACF8|nr:hypothetical protein [Mesorhizobium amorphae]
MPNFWNFLAGASLGAIGAVFLPSLFDAIFRQPQSEEQNRIMGLTLEGNGSRMMAASFSIVCMFAGMRLIQTVRFPQRWDSVSEMGWCVLIAAAIGSALFVRRAMASKFVLILSLIGLTAMTVVTTQGRNDGTPGDSPGSPSALNSSATTD